MMIDPESITVPSKSKRTTGKRMRSIVPRASVLDALEVEPPRRRRLAGLAAWTASEQRREIPAFEHRADEDPAHVAEEAHRLDREVQLVAVILPGGREHRPLEERVLRLGGREGGEVVRSRQQRRRGV